MRNSMMGGLRRTAVVVAVATLHVLLLRAPAPVAAVPTRRPSSQTLALFREATVRPPSAGSVTAMAFSSNAQLLFLAAAPARSCAKDTFPTGYGYTCGFSAGESRCSAQNDLRAQVSLAIDPVTSLATVSAQQASLPMQSTSCSEIGTRVTSDGLELTNFSSCTWLSDWDPPLGDGGAPFNLTSSVHFDGDNTNTMTWLRNGGNPDYTITLSACTQQPTVRLGLWDATSQSFGADFGSAELTRQVQQMFVVGGKDMEQDMEQLLTVSDTTYTMDDPTCRVDMECHQDRVVLALWTVGGEPGPNAVIRAGELGIFGNWSQQFGPTATAFRPRFVLEDGKLYCAVARFEKVDPFCTWPCAYQPAGSTVLVYGTAVGSELQLLANWSTPRVDSPFNSVFGVPLPAQPYIITSMAVDTERNQLMSTGVGDPFLRVWTLDDHSESRLISTSGGVPDDCRGGMAYDSAERRLFIGCGTSIRQWSIGAESGSAVGVNTQMAVIEHRNSTATANTVGLVAEVSELRFDHATNQLITQSNTSNTRGTVGAPLPVTIVWDASATPPTQRGTIISHGTTGSGFIGESSFATNPQEEQVFVVSRTSTYGDGNPPGEIFGTVDVWKLAEQ